jgi:hypothetical protein
MCDGYSANVTTTTHHSAAIVDTIAMPPYCNFSHCSLVDCLIMARSPCCWSTRRRGCYKLAAHGLLLKLHTQSELSTKADRHACQKRVANTSAPWLGLSCVCIKSNQGVCRPQGLPAQLFRAITMCMLHRHEAAVHTGPGVASHAQSHQQRLLQHVTMFIPFIKGSAWKAEFQIHSPCWPHKPPSSCIPSTTTSNHRHGTTRLCPNAAIHPPTPPLSHLQGCPDHQSANIQTCA